MTAQKRFWALFWRVAAGVDGCLPTGSHGMRRPWNPRGSLGVSRTSAATPSNYLVFVVILIVLEYYVKLFSVLINSDVFDSVDDIVDVKVSK